MNNVATIPPAARRVTSWNTLINVGGGVTPVSVLTTLLPWTNFGNVYDAMSIMLEDLDTANPVTLIVDVSFNGVNPNLERRMVHQVGGNGNALPCEGSANIDSPNPFTYVRVQAFTGAGFPTVEVNWSILGFRRY